MVEHVYRIFFFFLVSIGSYCWAFQPREVKWRAVVPVWPEGAIQALAAEEELEEDFPLEQGRNARKGRLGK